GAWLQSAALAHSKSLPLTAQAVSALHQVMYGKPLADLLAQVETQLHQELQPSRGEGRPALSESQLALLQKASAAVAELRAASAEMARGGTAAVTVKSDLAAASTPVPGEGAG